MAAVLRTAGVGDDKRRVDVGDLNGTVVDVVAGHGSASARFGWEKHRAAHTAASSLCVAHE
jgi:hypothetical protein